jgi:hypothetical protein
MQRTFVTERPETLQPNQAVVDLPRYEIPLAKALIRRDLVGAGRFSNDEEKLNIPPLSLNNVKMFVDELALVDKEIDGSVRVPYTNYVGVHFLTVADAVTWARKFVQRFFPATEERLLKRQLLTIPLDKTEIVWVGGERYLGFVQAVATAPSTDELVKENAPAAGATPQNPLLTPEEVAAKRAAIAQRDAERKAAAAAAKQALKAANKGGTNTPEAQTASTPEA